MAAIEPRLLSALASVIVSACSIRDTTFTPVEDSSLDDAASEGTAPPVLVMAITPADFDLHVRDTRDAVVTLTNHTTDVAGVPDIDVTDLTFGTMTFTSSTCTKPLEPGQSCNWTARFTGTMDGTQQFSLVATAEPGGSVTKQIPIVVRPPCNIVTCSQCCESSVVPGNAIGSTLEGESFFRSFDTSIDGAFPNNGNPATVSDFRLDKYEVTVSRFRQFVDAGMGTTSAAPAVGQGAHAKIPGSGWPPATILVADSAALKAALKCDPTYQTWTDAMGANETLPINCVTWAEAMAFCIWDGGYLPTEAECNYAAAGGAEQRAYPWSNPAGSTSIDCHHANYFVDVANGTCVPETLGSTYRVGATPAGDGRWGHSDLAGNIAEWTLDAFSTYPTSCDNCSVLDDSVNRIVRGGYFRNPASMLRAGSRNSRGAGSHDYRDGFRCARHP